VDKELVLELLAEASGKRNKNSGALEFGEQDKASALLANNGALYTIDEVVRIEVKDRYISIRTVRGEVYLIGLDHVIGFKLQRARKDVAGFVP
jgi:hypothetical protein